MCGWPRWISLPIWLMPRSLEAAKCLDCGGRSASLPNAWLPRAVARAEAYNRASRSTARPRRSARLTPRSSVGTRCHSVSTSSLLSITTSSPQAPTDSSQRPALRRTITSLAGGRPDRGLRALPGDEAALVVSGVKDATGALRGHSPRLRATSRRPSPEAHCAGRCEASPVQADRRRLLSSAAAQLV